jgi:hypothetical protein
MDPFLVQVAQNLDGYRERAEISRVLDELNFLFEALDESQQELAERLIATLTARLQSLP